MILHGRKPLTVCVLTGTKLITRLTGTDGIERNIMFVAQSPCEIYERKVSAQELHSAIASLPDKQAKRIYAYYFLGMSKAAIAKLKELVKALCGTASNVRYETSKNI